MNEAKKSVRQRRHVCNIFVGAKLGRLEVIELPPKHNGVRMAICKCECGTTRPLRFSSLENGGKSCGCQTIEILKSRGTHFLSKNLTFKVWKDMRYRCTDPNHHAYKDYGGRGITVCDRWMESFQYFLADMGWKPDGLQIDRENNDLGYSPENCGWATRKTQMQNRRICVNIEIGGVTKVLAEWCRIKGIDEGTVRDRIRAGMDKALAITTPVRHYAPRIRTSGTLVVPPASP